MFQTNSLGDKKICEILREGGVGVLPTDTLYGIVGSALRPETVQQIYRLRKRNLKKPMIILISSLSDLKKFGIVIAPFARRVLGKVWPGKVSVVLSCPRKQFLYLHRGKKSLAFRMPAKPDLGWLLKKTGPLVAPSANLEGVPPAMTIQEAKKYFNETIDFYVDGGRKESLQSTLIEIEGSNVFLRRMGAALLNLPSL